MSKKREKEETKYTIGNIDVLHKYRTEILDSFYKILSSKHQAHYNHKGGNVKCTLTLDAKKNKRDKPADYIYVYEGKVDDEYRKIYEEMKSFDTDLRQFKRTVSIDKKILWVIVVTIIVGALTIYFNHKSTIKLSNTLKENNKELIKSYNKNHTELIENFNNNQSELVESLKNNNEKLIESINNNNKELIKSFNNNQSELMKHLIGEE